MRLLETLQKWNGGRMPKGGRYALIVLLAGMLPLIWPQGTEKTTEREGKSLFGDAYLAQQQKEMESILSHIEGVGRLHLMLTVASEGKTDLASDLTKRHYSEDGRTGEEEKKTIVINRGNGYQETVVTQRTTPVYKGALVVCEGGEDASVRLAVTEAVRVLTGLGSDRITVVKGSA